MQSKWRGWKPSAEAKQSQIIGISSSPPPSEPSKPSASNGSDGFVAIPSSEIPIIHGPGPSNPRFWGVCGDVYGWKLKAAFDIICDEHYPAGMIPWLEMNASFLHDRLTRSLPEKITAAWNARLPLDQFDRLCGQLVCTHERAVDLYRQHLRLPAPQWNSAK